MSVMLQFAPSPPAEDPLNIDQVVQNRGVYGEGSDTPMLAVEDDLSVYALVGTPEGFACELVTDLSGYQGRLFRRLHGQVTITHIFAS